MGGTRQKVFIPVQIYFAIYLASLNLQSINVIGKLIRSVHLHTLNLHTRHTVECRTNFGGDT